jgi:hypothetical protein
MSLLAQGLCNIGRLVMFGWLAVGWWEIEIAGALCFRWDKLVNLPAGFETAFISSIGSFLESFVGFRNYWFASRGFVLDYHLESF